MHFTDLGLLGSVAIVAVAAYFGHREHLRAQRATQDIHVRVDALSARQDVHEAAFKNAISELMQAVDEVQTKVSSAAIADELRFNRR